MRQRFRLWLTVVFGLTAVQVGAHVGSPFIVFEGRAGNFPVRVVVRQPDVVPGLADISVKVLDGRPTGVRVLPLHGNTDVSGAPRADVATPVSGETNLFTAALWLMSRGAYGIEVQVEGPGGGAAIVPTNSIAHERKPMPAVLGFGLALAGLGLALGVIGIAIGAAREATLATGISPGKSRRRWAIITGMVSIIGLTGVIYGSSAWWNQVDHHHHSRVLYRQLTHEVSLVSAPNPSGAQLRLTMTDPRFGQTPYLPVPEHGKMIHLFLVGEETASGVPAFAHLHPKEAEGEAFETALPALPGGRYRVFTELAHEQGFAQTLTNLLELHAATSATSFSDPDDSFAPPSSGNWQAPLAGDLSMQFKFDSAPAGQASRFQARVVRTDGSPAPLDPYLRMLGHAVAMRDDGSVFAHVHPAGSLSMAAARTFARKLSGEAGVRATEVNCGDLESLPPNEAAAMGRDGVVSFPYVFPSVGDYFIWVQVKVGGLIHTGSFRVEYRGQELISGDVIR